MIVYDDSLEAVRAADKAAKICETTYAICVTKDKKIAILPFDAFKEQGAKKNLVIIEVVYPPLGAKKFMRRQARSALRH